MRHGDTLLYEQPVWQCPRTLGQFKLQVSMTKNENMRVDVWRWNTVGYGGAVGSLSQTQSTLDTVPLFTIVPFELARRTMEDVDFDLELFARHCVYTEGAAVRVARVQKVRKLQKACLEARRQSPGGSRASSGRNLSALPKVKRSPKAKPRLLDGSPSAQRGLQGGKKPRHVGRNTKMPATGMHHVAVAKHRKSRLPAGLQHLGDSDTSHGFTEFKVLDLNEESKVRWPRAHSHLAHTQRATNWNRTEYPRAGGQSGLSHALPSPFTNPEAGHPGRARHSRKKTGSFSPAVSSGGDLHRRTHMPTDRTHIRLEENASMRGLIRDERSALGSKSNMH